MPSSKIQSLIGHFTHFHLLDSNCHPAQLGSWWLNMHRTDGPFSMAPQQLPYRAFGNYLFTRPTEPCLNGGSGAVLHWCTWLCFPTSWPEFTGPVPRLYQNGISPWKEARNMTQPRTEWCLMLLIRRMPLDPRERRAGVDVQQLRFIMTCLSLAIQPRRTDLFGEKMSIKVQSDFNHTSLLLSKVKVIVLSALVEFHRRRCSAVNLMNL